VQTKHLAQAQRRCFARDDEIRDENSDGVPKKYGLRTFIPPSLVDSDDYWHHTAAKCFAISTQLGAPRFFLTFTMNPHRPDYEALKRGADVVADSAMGSIIFKTKLSALMKFIQKKRFSEMYRHLYGELTIRNEMFHMLISCFELALIPKLFMPLKPSSALDIQKILLFLTMKVW
jgi:hypothetical protein